MDTPRIQYARTEDGVSIAYWRIGSGPILIIAPTLVTSHVIREWAISYRRAAYERLAERATVVRYDPRGAGLSERDKIDYSPEAQVRDLVAVIDQLGADQVALCTSGIGFSGVAAFTGCADRISHLILAIGGSSVARPDTVDALDPLIDRDWETYTEIRARMLVGWDSADASSVADLARAAHTPRSFRAANEAIQALSSEPTALASAARVTASTLIMYMEGHETAERRARVATSAIPGAHMMGIPGVWAILPNALGVDPILDFIASSTGGPFSLPEGHSFDTGAFRTVLFTDLEAHTAMMQRLGDAKGRDVLRAHERACREALRAHGGTEVKTIGDSFMASFPSAQKAVECAIALQQAFAAGDFAGERLSIRVGINAGEPIAEEDDLFGSSVILASRTKEKAKGGEIFVTDVVRQLLSGKSFAFADRGEMEMKGFDDPVRLFEVRWQA